MRTNSNFRTNQSDHRCSRCGLLLAKEQVGELIIRDQKHQYTFSGGTLKTICRRCGSLEVVAPVSTLNNMDQTEQVI